MRHFTDDGIDPFEVRRRIGRVKVDGLQVLDLTDPSVTTSLGLTTTDLLGANYATTQAVAAGLGGLLAPSAALPGRRTLVVFGAGMPAVTEEGSSVRQPPPRLADLLHAIRVRADMPSLVRDLLARLAAAGSDAVRRRRRR